MDKSGVIAVTGANGNLGRKLIAAMLETATGQILAIDRGFDGFPSKDPRLSLIQADLADPADSGWRAPFAAAASVAHLAAVNPHPDASWAEAGASFEITARLADAAQEGRISRFVFASSNHVMGGYKDTEVADRPGSLTVDLPALVGTVNQSDTGLINSVAYASAKFMGERLLAVKAAAGAFTAVSLRIGWCQPGVNDPATISASGTVKAGAASPNPSEDPAYRWFRGMWLSNRDLIGYILAALSADAAGWPSPAVIVNAVSRNAGMAWDLSAGLERIGYAPMD